MTIKDEIKAKIISKGWTIKDVAAELEKRYNSSYSPENLSNKLRRGTIKYQEVKDIADIIGYKIEWIKKQ
ncbi:hypothetical protein [Halothermothrix orenii]|uniref:LLM class flavin-dependent oxidoreductase n=1 Tax=Halothermothrix orenii (strain H 168 / OCM 544 / DSM 9562) TaxID=373903 RepID=B8D1P2_HALOH|nr:hypothetical protein [Halothermothrix orenii]ACL69119.1 hypothetical protein Hore_03580 [Halothermothrix orenii H 168]